MKSCVLAVFIVLALAASVLAQSATILVMNNAIIEFLSDSTSPDGFTKIAEKYFGTTFSPKPSKICSAAGWPTRDNLSPLMKQIINDKMIIYGANSVTNVPKRFNYTEAGQRNGVAYGKLTGYEADIGQVSSYERQRH